VPCFVAANCPLLLSQAARYRITAKPLLSVSCQKSAWRSVGALIRSYYQMIDYDYVVWRWLANIKDTKKYKKLRRAVDLHVAKGFSTSRRATQLKLKLDECQLHPSGKYCPRTIANVDPVIQAAVGPYIFEAMSRLKAALSIDNIVVEDQFQYTLTVGSGMTAVQLDTWYSNARNVYDVFHILVAGDDSLVMINELVLCADASSFDASQSEGPLEYEYWMLSRLGVPDCAIRVLREMSHLAYVYVDKKTGDELTIDRR
jgi:hypothetical protein